MFVPKGRVLLTVAVDRLAEAHDDGQNAARAELRAELHSGSMLAMVITGINEFLAFRRAVCAASMLARPIELKVWVLRRRALQ